VDKSVLRIFQREIEKQCKFAIMAIEDLQKALRIYFKSQGKTNIKPATPALFE
jgi:hypothetical protein